MTNGWYIKRQNGTAGPFSGAQLKELAASGRLHAEDRVRRGQDGKLVLASRVKGLFTRDEGIGRPDAPAVSARSLLQQQHGPAASESSPFTSVFSPSLSKASPIKHWPWLRILAALFLFVMLYRIVVTAREAEIQKHRQELAVAHELWSTGNKKSAIVEYRELVTNHPHAITDSDKATIYGRLIDFDAGSGNTTSAEATLIEAEGLGVVPDVLSKEGHGLLAARDAQRQEREREEKFMNGTPKEQLEAARSNDLIGAASLYNQYAGNEAAGDASYKGKTIFVVGEIVSVGKYTFAGTSLDLAHRTYSIGVCCFLTDAAAQSAELMTVRPGSWVKVRGVCEGLTFGGRVQIADCEFVVVEP